MKKITLLLLLTLFPIAVFSQTQTENYIKSTTYLTPFKGTFANYSQNLAITDLIYTGSGGGSGSVSISNNVLTVSFSGGWTQQAMRTGIIKALTATPVLPKIELGPILALGVQTGYFAKIENNNLIVYSPFFLSGVNSTLSASIVGGAPGVSFTASNFANLYSCPTGGGGGSSGTIAVSNGVVSLNFSGGWSSTCNLKLGNIVQLPTAVVNTELGIIKDQSGMETAYRAKIENNWLVFYAGQAIPALPTGGSFIFTFNLANTGKDRLENITYFDGLGRPKQQVANAQSLFSGKDIVTPIEYDAYGRQDRDYLPYTSQSATLDYKTTAKADLLSYYSNPTLALTGNSNFEATTNPYNQKKFQNAPSNRVLEQAAPGNDWSLANKHTIKTDFDVNDLDEVKSYSVKTVLDAAGVYYPTITSSGNYIYGVLYKTITKDENWTEADGKNKTAEEFRDKEGHVVLKRTYSNYTNTAGSLVTPSVIHSTYYVYDIYGNLSFVLPPRSEGWIDATSLKDWCYQYRYDYKNRLVEKKLPGKDWEYIVYDKLDRPILTQDANLRTTNKWIFTKYDALNRPVYTGDYVNTAQTTRALVQNLANGSAALFETKQGVNTINGITVYYSNNAFPNATTINLYTINYYDNYNFDLDGGTTETAYGITPIANAKGLVTGSKVKILGPNTWKTNVIYYDAKGRPIYNYDKNVYLSTTDKVKSNLDFVGKTLETTTTHTRGATTTTIVDAFTYHKTGKLLTQKQKINGQQEEMIVSNTYDELGLLISKGVGGKTLQSRLQKVDFAYNVRGWLKSINDVNTIGSDLFAFGINYNAAATGVTPLFNGNISRTQWKTANDPLANGPRTYNYAYDALNRLTMAIDKTSTAVNRYNESLYYDKNGNIIDLVRMGNTDLNATTFGLMDNLYYTYSEGKLIKVEDNGGTTEGFKNGSTAAVEYTYDANGNMKTDLNKGINGITYNFLNLPTQVITTGGTVNYVYDATGIKQQKVVNSITTDYAGRFIYENQGMKFFSHPEGYVANDAGVFSYIYQYKDHLGNARLSYGDKDNNGVIDPNLNELIEENNYYPFGMKQKGYNGGWVIGKGNATAQQYKYNGKELQDENMGGVKLNLYDYGARNYDPVLGRWMNIDPLAEKTPRFSPYAYALNNPVFFIDPDGKFSTRFGAWLHKTFNGGGGDIHQNTNNQYYYQTGTGTDNSPIQAHYGEKGVKGVQGDRGVIQQLASQVSSVTNTGVKQLDLIPENPLVKLDISKSITRGDAKVFNASTKTNFNVSTGSTENSIDNQLNLQVVNGNVETSASSITFGGEVSAFGRLGFGGSISLSSDILNSNISINGNGNFNGDNISSSLSAGIKPMGILATGAAIILNRIIPPEMIPLQLQYNAITPITPITTTTETMY